MERLRPGDLRFTPAGGYPEGDGPQEDSLVERLRPGGLRFTPAGGYPEGDGPQEDGLMERMRPADLRYTPDPGMSLLRQSSAGKVDVRLHTPSAYKATPRTVNANGLLKKAGVALQQLSKENSSLQERVLTMHEKVSMAERRDEITVVALDAAERGIIPLRSVRSKVSQWVSEGHPASYYKQMLNDTLDRSFASTLGAERTVAAEGVDKTKHSGHHDPDDGHSTHSRRFVEEMVAFNRANR